MIHPTAIIAPTARLAPDVEAGPYAIIEDGVRFGPGCRIAAHAQVLTGVTMGARNVVDRGAVIGGNPQSLSFDTSRPSRVRIGDDNIFREHVTVHRSAAENGETVLGSHNFLMAGSHLGHDSVLGDHNVLANGVLIAGHVTVGSRCFLGGGAGFHQFIRIGDLAMVQGNSAFSKDMPPFSTGYGINLGGGLNVVGLRRAGFDNAARLELKRAWAAVYQSVHGPVKGATAALEASGWSDAAQLYLRFIAATGSKGIVGPAST